MDPRKAESMGMEYDTYRTLERLSNENGYVDPYASESHGIEYSDWCAWQADNGYY